MKKKSSLFAFLIFLLLIFNSSGLTTACTDARVIAMDGSVLSARSMEFGAAMDSRLVVRPQGMEFKSPAPENSKGTYWTGQYGFVYLDGLGIDCVVDGLNEKGLGFGALYLPGFAKYEEIENSVQENALSNLQLGAWILSQFSSTDEVISAISDVKVWGEKLTLFGNEYVPLHYVIHDPSGKSTVLEWVDGKLSVYDNTTGVMTNSPPYEWHLTNLRNFISLSPDNSNPVKIGGVTYPANGQGSGLFGMPGDPTPPSRFIQTVFALRASDTPKDVKEALILGQKLLNRVDLPEGLAKDPKSGESDITQWAVFRDHKNKIYYYRTYNDMTLSAFDIKTADLSPGTSVRRKTIAVTSPTVKFIDQNLMEDISR
ncbi:MAG TPA: choloylglycine hydrolase family protein [Ignavibacteria bacterium]|nr:choloylglycine hydrolase family protein [Ignavibacteria bacterium]HMR39567.1 choloylglycine hydrolase family protein [Ignavibacteria bacterium]